MLGRKQSLKGEPVLADYGPEECLNESADIEWVNKVKQKKEKLSNISILKLYFNNNILVLDKTIDEILCIGITCFSLFEYSKDI